MMNRGTAHRILLLALLFVGLLAATPKPSVAWISICDNSDPCLSTCTVWDDSGKRIIRQYVINRCF